MGGGRLSEAAIERIERYQHKHGGRGRCGFSPTCSSFAKGAFRTRAFPVALLMTMSRLARCNRFAGPNVADPVVRTRRGLRANTVQSTSVLFLVTGVVLIALSSAGHADSFSGSCTGSAIGRDIKGMTQSNPLVLKEHQQFSAQGTAGFNGSSDPTSVTSKIEIINGLLGVTNTNNAGTGNNWSSSTVKVDDYFKYGVGLYQVDITVSGPKGSCAATAFVKLDGNPLTKPAGIVGLAFSVGGAVTGVRARLKGKNPKRKKNKKSFIDQVLDASDQRAAAIAAAPENPEVGDMGIYEFADYLSGCGRFFFHGPLLALPVFGMGVGAGAASMPKPRVVWSKKVRVHGHPILGFFSGLIAGLGAVVLAWQYAVWTLQIWNTVGIPVLVGILFAVWAWAGKSYRIQVRSGGATPATEEPAAAVPAAEAGKDPDPEPPPAPAS